MMAAWWQTGIVYEVYPRSFQDSGGDGTGDLRGVTRRLDHCVRLGIDAVWVTPFFPSPMTDFGYDVADYCGVDPLFGTMDDFDALLARAHALGLKLILDFVPNHTSSEHPWFHASRERREGHDDWYLWHDPAQGGGPPNNWLSNFSGPGWTWDDTRRQFYYHSFLPTQPDLNWRNPAVRHDMFDAMRFWLRKGVDGFRVDVMWMMIKDDQYRDNPPNPDWRPGDPEHDRLRPLYTSDRPEVHQVVAEMRAVLDEFDDRVLIGELYLPVDRLVAYYGENLRGAQMPFNFQLLLLKDWTAAAIADLVRRYEAALPPGAWPNWVLGNHDRPRIASRVGAAQARIAAMLLLTLRGTPTVYMGDELGMLDTPIPPDAVRDPAGRREPGQGRDPERTPFPWEPGPGAGFTTGTPWLPIGTDMPLETQAQDPHSMWSLHQALIALRRAHPALVEGVIDQVEADGPVLRYRRVLDGQRLLMLLNTASKSADTTGAAGRVLVSTHPPAVREVATTISLRPDEGLVMLLD